MLDVKAKICDLLRETQRVGIHHLIDYMENSGFFTAPCSTQFHLAELGPDFGRSATGCFMLWEPRVP